MRLTPEEKEVIIETVLSLDAEAKIYLFGSRVDPEKRGGDIDLLIFSKILSSNHKRLIRNTICDKLGEQKIDLLIAQDESSPFVRKSKILGIKLND